MARKRKDMRSDLYRPAAYAVVVLSGSLDAGGKKLASDTRHLCAIAGEQYYSLKKNGEEAKVLTGAGFAPADLYPYQERPLSRMMGEYLVFRCGIAGGDLVLFGRPDVWGRRRELQEALHLVLSNFDTFLWMYPERDGIAHAHSVQDELRIIVVAKAEEKKATQRLASAVWKELSSPYHRHINCVWEVVTPDAPSKLPGKRKVQAAWSQGVNLIKEFAHRFVL